jgi:hypothetical protein
VEKVTGVSEKLIDLSKYQKGVYFLEVLTGNTQKSFKLVIQ